MIKRIDDFLNESKLEYSSIKDANDMKVNIHNPDIFVYANNRLWDFCELMCSQLNKYAGLNMYINGMFGKIDGEKCVMFIDRNSDKCVCMVPYRGRTMFAALYYFENLNSETNTADFYMSSTNVGIVNIIKTFCSMIKTGTMETISNVNEAKDLNLRKLLVTPSAEAYAKAVLNIKPGEIGCGRNKRWEGTWTEELISEIRNGVNVFEISEDVETNRQDSKYWKYFQGMGKDNRDTLLVYLLRKSGINIGNDKKIDIENPIYTDEDEWYQKLTGMTKEDAEQATVEYDKKLKSIEETVGDFVDFYKAKGNEKLEILKYTKQLLIVPGKGGIGKTSTVEKFLTDRGLRENIDYVALGNASSAAESIYNFCYEYNGKIIIFDDIPSLFNGTQRVSFWKNLISGSMGRYGKPSAPVSTTNSNYYDPKKFENDNRGRYYAEAGDGSTMSDSKKRRLNTALGSSDPIIKMRAQREMEDLELSSNNMVKPSTFTFTGAIIALTNNSPEELEREVGSEQSWKAIETRGRVITMNPPGWMLYLKDKNIILAQKEDKSIPDEATIIPREKMDEYMEYVEHVISNPDFNNYNYRIIAYVGPLMRKNREWKDVVEQMSRTKQISFKKIK